MFYLHVGSILALNKRSFSTLSLSLFRLLDLVLDELYSICVILIQSPMTMY